MPACKLPCEERYPLLFSPLDVGGRRLKNRIVTAPSNHTHVVGEGNRINEEAVVYYGGKAKGGAAMVTLGEARMDKGNSLAHLTHIDLTEEASLSGLHSLTDYIHSFGALASVELNHNGHFALPEYCNGEQPMAASEIRMPNGNLAREMDEEDMERVARRYVNAVRMARRGQFDTVLLHYGHGWLMGGFLSPLVNRRKDRYGGSVENRCRFPLMVLQRIRKELPDMLLELRLSGDEFTPGGIVLEEAVEMASIFAPYVDLMHLSCGTRLNAVTRGLMHPTHFVPQGHVARFAQAVKEAGVKCPVGTIGGIDDPAEAERLLQEGMADYVVMCRAFIADEDWAEKARRGREDAIRPCIKCLRCLDVGAGRVNTSTAVLQDFTNATKHVGCTVNPWFGRQTSARDYPAPEASRRVVVVGGGPGGMQAALTAARRGHQVTLYEESGRLGGQLGYTDYVWFKHDMKAYRDYLIRMVEQAPITVKRNTRATPELVYGQRPDAVIVALGAEPIRPPIPGADLPHVIQGLDVYAEPERLGRRVAIVGGGLVGLETALHLARHGKDVTIVQMEEFLAPDGYFTERLSTIDRLDRDEHIRYFTSTTCTRILESGIVVEDAEGRREITADSVVLCCGMKARAAERDAFQGTALDVIPVGDCVRAGLLRNAVWQGHFAAYTLR